MTVCSYVTLRYMAEYSSSRGPIRTSTASTRLNSSTFTATRDLSVFIFAGRNLRASGAELPAGCVRAAPPSRLLLLLYLRTVARRGSCCRRRPLVRWLIARMQQNGSSGSNGSNGSNGPDGGSNGRERQPLSFSPLPAAATTRVRRFIQERRTLPLPRVMVVFSAAGDTEKPGDAMSSSDSTEDDFRKPVACPSPSLALSKPLQSPLRSQEQEVGRPLHWPEENTLNQLTHRLTHRKTLSSLDRANKLACKY